mmetsp:Transcript_82910/g.96908  ORF Transcript_82910/g.96908 Transcript_82910/m.96908 type:complete len:246 (-) Transcript_82910:159-896(-)
MSTRPLYRGTGTSIKPVEAQKNASQATAAQLYNDVRSSKTYTGMNSNKTTPTERYTRIIVDPGPVPSKERPRSGVLIIEDLTKTETAQRNSRALADQIQALSKDRPLRQVLIIEESPKFTETTKRISRALTEANLFSLKDRQHSPVLMTEELNFTETTPRNFQALADSNQALSNERPRSKFRIYEEETKAGDQNKNIEFYNDSYTNPNTQNSHLKNQNTNKTRDQSKPKGKIVEKTSGSERIIGG